MELQNGKSRAGRAMYALLWAALLTICLELGLSYLRPGAVSTVPRHLIHFLIMLLLCVGGGLLFAYCPPLRRAREWLELHLLNPETRKPACEIVYGAAAGAMLLHHFYVIACYPDVTAGAVRLAPVWVVMAVLTILMGKTRGDRGFLIAAVLFIYTFERLFLKHLSLTGRDTVYFFTAAYAFFFAYGVFFVLRPALRGPFLRALCALWSLGTAVLCGVGIYTAWTGLPVRNLAGGENIILLGRLMIFGNPNPNITACILACGTAMTLLGFTLEKNWAVRALYLLICFASLVTVSLTDSRSAYMMIAFLLAGTVCLGIRQAAGGRLRTEGNKGKAVLSAAALLLCFALCFLLSVKGQQQLSGAFMKIRDRGVLPTALAENIAAPAPRPDDPVPVPTESPLPSFDQRDAWISEDQDIDFVLTGRYEIWKNAFRYIQQHPKTLLMGLSVDGTAAQAGEREEHVHNVLLQTLLEGGLPALLLFLALLISFLPHAWTLWKTEELPLWQRMLPLPVLAILLQEMAECLAHFSFGHPPVTVFWFFMGCTVAVSKTLREKKNAAPGREPESAAPAVKEESFRGE